MESVCGAFSTGHDVDRDRLSVVLVATSRALIDALLVHGVVKAGLADEAGESALRVVVRGLSWGRDRMSIEAMETRSRKRRGYGVMIRKRGVICEMVVFIIVDV